MKDSCFITEEQTAEIKNQYDQRLEHLGRERTAACIK